MCCSITVSENPENNVDQSSFLRVFIVRGQILHQFSESQVEKRSRKMCGETLLFNGFRRHDVMQ